jgi:hypothetical protein
LTASAELTSGKVRDFVVARPDGAERTVNVPLRSLTGDLYAGSTRAGAWLTDFGAGDVLYFNADGQYATSQSVVDSVFAQAASARGIIIDMRGHPANGGAIWDAYALVGQIATNDVTPPIYRVPVLDGVGGRSDIST